MMSFQKIYSPMQLANAMKLVRQQNGWTQSELAMLMSRTIMNRQRLDSPLVYVGAHNVYYVKLPVKVLYFTIHIHTQINQYVVISGKVKKRIRFG